MLYICCFIFHVNKFESKLSSAWCTYFYSLKHKIIKIKTKNYKQRKALVNIVSSYNYIKEKNSAK